jgi:hypothetical protein
MNRGGAKLEHQEPGYEAAQAILTVLKANEICIGLSVLRLNNTTATDLSANGLHHIS